MSYLKKILLTGLSVAIGLVLTAAAFSQTSLDELARDVDRAESISAVKNLQRTYAQYSQYGSVE